MNTSNHEPLHELKHDPVPGYQTIFTIVFVSFSIYLAVVLISSPGKVKKDKGYDKIEETSHH